MRIKQLFAVFLALALVLFAIPANAQTPALTATATPVNLSLNVGESLTISVSPSSISFGSYDPTAGTATASGPITVVTTANLNAGHGTFETFAWLGSATAALSGPANVPSSKIFSSNNSLTAVPCTDTEIEPNSSTFVGSVMGAGCTTGGRLGIIIAPPAGVNSQTDTVLLSLSGAANLIPGSYAGVINFEAAIF